MLVWWKGWKSPRRRNNQVYSQPQLNRSLTMSLVEFSQSNNEGESPFNAIRHFNEHGNEFWEARELQKVMGYKSWRRFETPINTAMENLELVGDVVSDHFDGKDKRTKGRKGNDYKLTRYACYMIALACDGRKPEVAMAKKYFAIKTRQAELKEAPKPKTAIEMAKETLRLAQQNVELLEEIERQQLMIEDLEDQNLYLSEMADELFNYSSILRVAKFNNVSEKEFSWHRLKATSKQLDVEIKQAPCPRYGYKNIYSHTVWRKAYPNVRLPEDRALIVA